MKVKKGTLKISSLKMSDFGDYICEAKLLTLTFNGRVGLQENFLRPQCGLEIRGGGVGPLGSSP